MRSVQQMFSTNPRKSKNLNDCGPCQSSAHLPDEFLFSKGQMPLSSFGVALLHVLSTTDQMHSGRSDAPDFRRIPKNSFLECTSFGSVLEAHCVSVQIGVGLTTLPGKFVMHESLVDELVVRLVDRLLSQAWPAGKRIPTERRLSEEFQMSRATVRSAIDRLSGWNMLVARQGSGTLAMPRGKWRVGVFPYLMASFYRSENWGELVPLIFDALGLRRGLVLDFLERAAAHTQGKDMTASREACNEAWEGRNSSAFLAADDRYHMSILDIAGLTATKMLINEIEQTYENAVTIFAGEFKLPEMYQDTHLSIIDALEAGDGATARALKSTYYEKMDEALLGGLPPGMVSEIMRLVEEK